MTDAELAIVVKLKDMFSKQLDSIVKNTDKSAKQMEGSWKKLTMGITAAKVAVVGWLTGQAAQAVKSMGDFAAKVDRANVAFGAMSRRVGVDATTAIKVMREASGGAVSDLDLMAAANRAIMLGAVKTTEELRNLTYYGAKLGNAMGLAASQGIDYFTTGLARQSNAILDNVGLIIDLEGEYKRLGKTADELTEDERRSIFSAAVWRQAQEAVSSLGDQLPTIAMAVDKIGSSWENLKKTLADWVAPGLKGFLSDLDNVITSLNTVTKLWKMIPFNPVASHPESKVFGTPRAEEPYIDFFPREELEAAERKSKVLSAIGAGNKRSLATAKAREDWEFGEQSWEKLLKYRESIAPTEEDKSYVEQVWNAMGEGVKRYYETVKDSMALVSTAVYRAFQDIETSIGDVFFDAMMGKMKTFKDYLKSFIQDIGRTLSQFMARQAVQSLISIGIASGIGSIFSAGTGTVSTTGDFPARLAVGGITSGPSLAGEAGPEAVVPLPGNRKIPVEMNGSRGGNVTYIINAIDTQTFASALLGNRATIHRLVTEGLGEDTQLRSAVRAV